MDIGPRLKLLLKARKVKQSTVAADLGISAAKLSRMLSGESELTVDALLRVAELTNESPSVLLGGAVLPAETRKVLRLLVDQALPLLEEVPPDITDAGSDAESRVLPLRVTIEDNEIIKVRVRRTAATPDNPTFDDPEPREQEIPAAFARAGATDAFEVCGNSMQAAGILSGDIVFTRPLERLEEANGEIVVCRIGNERYVKRAYLRRRKLRLVSASRGHRVWTFDRTSDEVKILGVVIGRLGRTPR